MKKFGLALAKFSVDRPRVVMWLTLVPTVVLLLAAALPSVWPRAFPWLNGVTVDTDPENMLSHDEAVRLFHDKMKHEFSLNDIVVLGVVNEEHPDGVFNAKSLAKVYELAEFAKTLTWEASGEEGRQVGVIEADLIAPSTVDNIEPGGPGVVTFEWLMSTPPATDEEARAVRDKARRIPFLEGTLISEDGKAVCLYLPITSKDLSYRIYSRLQDKIATFDGHDKYFITGLPVAEDTFGVEMFKQMAISAPLAMLAIFLLMLYFFRKLSLIISPLIVAMISVIWTMGLLIVSGNTIHIMSSMIPIFIMPIAVLDSIHILSMFFDRYQQTKDRRATVLSVTDSLFMAMLYTSLTSAAGFASLALTPIPPVQVFGLFCATGIMAAWALTVTFIPAFVALIPESVLANFGHTEEDHSEKSTMSRLLQAIGRTTYRRAWAIVWVTVAVVAVAVYGMGKIRINDNPTKWFKPSHPIRVSDAVLNAHFGGTYMAYLALESEDETIGTADYAEGLADRLQAWGDAQKEEYPGADQVARQLAAKSTELVAKSATPDVLLQELIAFADSAVGDAPDAIYDAWEEGMAFVERENGRKATFKQPEVLRYIGRLQEHLVSHGYAGKVNSLPDVVKTVHRELFEGAPEHFSIPDSSAAVAQCLITYQNSHRPQDLWHFVSPDYRKTVLWLQLRSGDNVDMVQVVKAVDEYVAQNPPPVSIRHRWFGLTYINVVWQDKMVSGMMSAFLGSFLVVFLMMTVLFGSALWGLLCMLPLTVTIGLIYGTIGLVGKDYDMPVAVLSALALGLAVDFAIHFLEHARVTHAKDGSWKDAAAHMFGEPARAIMRNVIVIAVGFTPLLAAPLVPYITVGVFLAAILAVSGVATLMLLPALLRLLERYLFPETRACCFACNCVTCTVSSVAMVALVAINVRQFLAVGWGALTWASAIAIPVLATLCWWSSRRERCQITSPAANQKGEANNE